MRPEGWNARDIAAKARIEAMTDFGYPPSQEGLVNAGADALIAADYRPVPSEEEILDKLLAAVNLYHYEEPMREYIIAQKREEAKDIRRWLDGDTGVNTLGKSLRL